MSPVVPAWATRLLHQCPSCPALLPSRLTLASHMDDHDRLARSSLSSDTRERDSDPNVPSAEAPALESERADSSSPESTVLEEDLDPNYEPSEAEVLEYAEWLGMDVQNDQRHFCIAREGLKARLPPNWKPCRTNDTLEIYYFNFATGESRWDHPRDVVFRKMFEDRKANEDTVTP